MDNWPQGGERRLLPFGSEFREQRELLSGDFREKVKSRAVKLFTEGESPSRKGLLSSSRLLETLC